MARVGWAVAGTVATLLIAAAQLQADVPWPLRLVLLAVWAVALWSPLSGLSIFLVVAPAAPALLPLCGPTPMTGEGFTDALAVATVGGLCCHTTRRYASQPTRLARPAVIFGALILAGALVDLSLVHLLSPSTGTFVADLWTHVTTTYFTDQRSLASWHLSAHWLEALCLAVFAERLVRSHEGAGTRLTHSLALGLVLAAGFSVLRLIDIVSAAPEWTEALARHLTTTRISPFLPDVNATGSLLALATVVWGVLAVTGPRAGWRRVLPWGAAAVCALALWLSGSRAAQAAALVGLGTAALWMARPSRRVLLVAGLTLAAAVTGLALLMPTRTTQSSAAASLGVRWDMARISLDVFGTAPLFGVGVGQFREASIPFVSEALMARFPQTRVGENAHNQALQILGEWGLTGLIAWVGLLVVAARGLISQTRPAWRGAVAGGWTAFLGSALLGHPWLLGPVILLTIPLLGLLSSGRPLPAPTRGPSRLAAGCVLLTLAAVPWRAGDLRRSTDLDHHVVGASRTAGELDGVPYRITRAHSTWFVRVSAQVIEIPLRVDPEVGLSNCTVTLDVDGLPANVVVVSTDDWTRVRFTLTAGKYLQVNRRIDLHATPDTCGLRVGRFTIRD